MSLRTSSGRSSVICCATIPPIEKPRRSTFVNPRPSMNAPAFFAMPAKVVGTSPVELDAAAVSQDRQQLLHQEERRADIDGEELVEIFDRGVLDRRSL